jgi:hypothetical protein
LHAWGGLDACLAFAERGDRGHACRSRDAGHKRLQEVDERADKGQVQRQAIQTGSTFPIAMRPTGAVYGVTMGRKIAKTWTADRDGLCLTDSFGENCYAVWMKGSAVKLFIGSGAFMEGFLK